MAIIDIMDTEMNFLAMGICNLPSFITMLNNARTITVIALESENTTIESIQTIIFRINKRIYPYYNKKERNFQLIFKV